MAFGVDLGTTNSSIAWSDNDGNVHSLKVRVGRIEPFDAVERSVVFDPEGDDCTVGQDAFAKAARHPGVPILTSFKRRFDKQRLRQHTYRHTLATTNDYDPVTQSIKVKETVERIPVYYDRHSREEVVAAGGRVFNHLLTRAELDPETESTGEMIRLVASAAESDPAEPLYVGVPVLFGPTARRRLLASLVASECFGSGDTAYTRALKRCRLVYEPLALLSTLTLHDPQNVVVFDYGGGTLDIAVISVRFDPGVLQPRYTELALGGVPRAGDALDERFRDALIEARPQLAKAYAGQISSGSDADIQRANSSFANAKIRLSKNDEVELALFNQSVTRAEFEAAITPELDAAVASLRDALALGGLDARDVGTVLLTGGSSLIPAVQDRLRNEFEHIDEFSFHAGSPSDVDDAREALTGVSRGLARFGFLERFESSAPCDYSVVVPGVSGKVVCLGRGSTDVRAISKAAPARVPVSARPTSTFALYADLVREAYCGAVVDVELPPGTESVEIRVSASRDRFAPAFSVYAPKTRAAIATFDLDGMNASDLAAFVQGDAEWVPSSAEPSAFVLTKRLALGDFVTWVANGERRRGQVVSIRRISSGESVVEMVGFDPEHYVVKVAREVAGIVELGTVTPGWWKIGEVRLD